MSALKKLDLLLGSLDEKSKEITTYLLRERHAGIKELTALICASSDMETLLKIREIINPKAQRVIGKPIATFYWSKIDCLTGQKIGFNWWADEELASSAHSDYLVDVINEESILRVVAALPSRANEVKVTVADSFLIISGDRYHQEVPLPCLVDEKNEKTIHNGVLEIKLNKRRTNNANRN